jgi:cytochrome c5
MERSSLLGALAALVISTYAALAQFPKQGPALPEGPGRDIVAVACSQCHTLSVIYTLREGQPGWRNHVANMVIRGAQLTASEYNTVLKYLTNNFGPGAGPAQAAKQITLPTGLGKELVETRCASCHDLERVTIVKRSAREWGTVVVNMVGRGAAATPDDAKEIVTYLSDKFGRAE